jgi:hypothetical protein
MKGIVFKIMLLAGLVALPGAGSALTMMDRAIGIGTGIVSDPAGFLYDLHQNMEDVTPSGVGRHVEFGTCLFPSFMPMAMLNGNAKVQVLREHGGIPQLDLLGGGWTSLITKFVPDITVDWWGWNLGFLVSATVDPRMRLFGGYEYSQMRASWDLKGKIKADSKSGALDMTSLNTGDVGKTEHILTIGSEVLRGQDKLLVAQLGFGLTTQRLSARLTWKGNVFDSGITFYPEGSWVLWPFEAYRLKF